MLEDKRAEGHGGYKYEGLGLAIGKVKRREREFNIVHYLQLISN